jgi:hypothetical protein
MAAGSSSEPISLLMIWLMNIDWKLLKSQYILEHVMASDLSDLKSRRRWHMTASIDSFGIVKIVADVPLFEPDGEAIFLTIVVETVQ